MQNAQQEASSLIGVPEDKLEGTYSFTPPKPNTFEALKYQLDSYPHIYYHIFFGSANLVLLEMVMSSQSQVAKKLDMPITRLSMLMPALREFGVTYPDTPLPTQSKQPTPAPQSDE